MIQEKVQTPLAVVLSVVSITSLVFSIVATSQPSNPQVKMAATVSQAVAPLTQITLNYNTLDAAHPNVSRNLFGEELEMSGGHFSKIFNTDGTYNQAYFNLAKSIGFTQLRFGGASCETSYDWYANVNSPTLSYRKWRKYAMDLTGNEPTICVSMFASDYQKRAVDMLKDSIAQGFNITNWEMGNEDVLLLSPTDYAARAKATCLAMKAIKSDVKCGISLAPSASNAYWNTPMLSGIGSSYDFVVPHFYSPDSFLDTRYFYYSAPITYTVNLAGNANYTFKIASRIVNSGSCTPKLKVQVDGADGIDTAVTNTWQDYSSEALALTPGAHTVTVSNSGDQFNGQNCNSVLYFANLSANSDSGDVASVDVWNKKDWTYSLWGATEYLKSEIANVKSLTSKPAYATEYGFNYAPMDAIYSSYKDLQSGGYGWAKSQFDWRSNLFVALQLNTMIGQGIDAANAFSDMSSGYWSYVSGDGSVKYPLYYIYQLYSQKTGSNLVTYTVSGGDAFTSNSNITPSAPNVSSVPYLSILPTKDTVNKKYYLTIINRNQDSDEPVQISFNGDSLTGNITITKLAGATPDSHPYKDGSAITPQTEIVPAPASQVLSYTIPKYSVVLFEVGYSSGPVCTPDCAGKTCGDNGCGGSCGTCVSPKTCQSGNCACTPSCLGKSCGATDGCGGKCQTGTCSSGKACVNGACQCVPTTCAQLNKTCGSQSNGCGGTINCGTCTAAQNCSSGVCVVKSCTDNACCAAKNAAYPVYKSFSLSNKKCCPTSGSASSACIAR